MDIGSEIKKNLGDDWIPKIYAEKVRAQRTRAFSLDVAEKENKAEIQYTLLGIELKVGNKRFASPDLATARYLQIFARIGCRDFAVPYDITKISSIADEMEIAWRRLLLLVDLETKPLSASSRGRIRSGLLRSIRGELAEIGAGDLMPQFKQSTKQRVN
jgi:hypothetical protein